MVTHRTLHGSVQRKSRLLFKDWTRISFRRCPFGMANTLLRASCTVNQHSTARFSVLTYAVLYFLLKNRINGYQWTTEHTQTRLDHVYIFAIQCSKCSTASRLCFLKALKQSSLQCLDINHNCIACEMCHFSFKCTYLR